MHTHTGAWPSWLLWPWLAVCVSCAFLPLTQCSHIRCPSHLLAAAANLKGGGVYSKTGYWLTVVGSMYIVVVVDRFYIALFSRLLTDWQWWTQCIVYCYCWSVSYSTILHSWADSLRSHVILNEWLGFYSAFLYNHWSGVSTIVTWLMLHETAAISVHSVYTIQHAPWCMCV